MIVVVQTPSRLEWGEEDYTEFLNIVIDGSIAAAFVNGEPEDNNLGRNFNDCYNIVAMMRAAYEAGKAGEEFEVKQETADE